MADRAAGHQRLVRKNGPRRIGRHRRQVGQHGVAHLRLDRLAPVQHLAPGRAAVQVQREPGRAHRRAVGRWKEPPVCLEVVEP
uniref:hypothetical protein n=1 Tax=unclassified Variovorax TaxID=663243 RepID=UPI0040392F99